MLEIFALCSCACLACLWCAVVLELTKEKCSRKGVDEIFCWNNSKCSKNNRCNHKGVVTRKSCNKDTRENNLEHNKYKISDTKNRTEIKKKDEETTYRCCHCSHSTSISHNSPFSRSQSFPHLRTNHCNYSYTSTITPCKRACKICRRMKHSYACARDNNFVCENSSSWCLCVHRASCPNLMSQGRCCAHDKSPAPYFYKELLYDPYQQSISPNISKDRRKRCRQGQVISRRKRCFPRIRKER